MKITEHKVINCYQRSYKIGSIQKSNIIQKLDKFINNRVYKHLLTNKLAN